MPGRIGAHIAQRAQPIEHLVDRPLRLVEMIAGPLGVGDGHVRVGAHMPAGLFDVVAGFGEMAVHRTLIVAQILRTVGAELAQQLPTARRASGWRGGRRPTSGFPPTE